MSTTPILDLLAPLPQTPVARWKPSEPHFFPSMLVIAASGLTLSLNYVYCGSGIAQSTAWVVAAWFLCATLHECGHLTAGLLLGYECHSIVIGPLSRTRYGGRSRWRLNSAQFSGSRVLMWPSRPGFPVWHGLMQTAAGPIAGFVPALIVAVVWLFERELVHACEVPILLAATFMLVISLIPYAHQGTMSDGAHLLALARGEGPAMYARLDLMARHLRNEPPSTWEATLVDQAAAPIGSSPAQFMGASLAYTWAKDRQDAAQAAAFIECALTNSGHADRRIRQWLYMEAAYVQARLRSQGRAALLWFQLARAVSNEPEVDQSSGGGTVLLSIEDRFAGARTIRPARG
jgi:hypothetical protein